MFLEAGEGLNYSSDNELSSLVVDAKGQASNLWLTFESV